jgi:hypothetical protein
VSLVARSGGDDRDTQHTSGATIVGFIIIFTLGYLLGGVSALFILGLTVAARQGDRGHATPPPVEKRV